MAGTDPRDGRFASGISGPGTTLAANRLVLLAAVPLFLILALCAYLTIQFAANEREAQGWVRHTYQVIEQLDLVISVDTSTAHVAGAMGKPLWILNRYDTCWRWLMHRRDTPWYPTATLYRQENAGDWDGVIRSIKSDLTKLTGGAPT